MKKYILMLIGLVWTGKIYCQQHKPDTMVIKFPFAKYSSVWPFDSLEIKTDKQIYHLFYDSIKQTILCIQTDYNGCLFTVGTYNLYFNDTIFSVSYTEPSPPYITKTTYVKEVDPRRDGVWVFFSNGVILTREKY